MKDSAIYYNGEIHTLDEENHIYEAVAVKEGVIQAVGSDAEVLSLQTESTQLIDLQEGTMFPGFIDAHQHLLHLGYNLMYVDCRLDSIEAVVLAVEEAAKNKSEQDWIIGWGFNEVGYKEGRKLNKWDFAHIKHPIYITRYCHHEAVVNETALQLAGITARTEVTNGIIEKSEQGEVTGLLIEQAMGLAQTVLPPYTIEGMREALQLANKKNIESGITSVHEAGLGFLDDPFKEFAAYEAGSLSGELQIKVNLMILGEYFEQVIEQISTNKTQNIRLGPMKLFADGTLSGRTAAMLHPYRDSAEKGLLLHKTHELKSYVEKAHHRGTQVAIHAIGDRAIDQVLQIYEALQKENPQQNIRHRIEHATVTNDDLLTRMEKLDIIPVPQPTLVYEVGDLYCQSVEDRFLDHIFAIQDFLSYQLRPAGSSDTPIIDCNPLLGIAAAMERKAISGRAIGKQQKINLHDALKMYTKNAAYAAFEEEVKGTIELGKEADFVVLPKDFIHFSIQEIRDTLVEMTIIDGEVVYKAK